MRRQAARRLATPSRRDGSRNRRHTVLRDVYVLRLCVTVFCLTLLGVACSHAPPAGFAPDPGLVVQIRSIRIVTAYTRACPGATISANYEAVLADGARVPFSRSYDKKHPPRLHVVFLDRESPDAVPLADWLVMESRGGRGGTGTAGTKGTEGAAGAADCPPQPGGPGGNGGNGGPGGAGGRGGRISVIVPVDNPFLAGMVSARSPGGPGGQGGAGGAGGKGGKGGTGSGHANNRRCADAADGAPGQTGNVGVTGTPGAGGTPALGVHASPEEG